MCQKAEKDPAKGNIYISIVLRTVQHVPLPILSVIGVLMDSLICSISNFVRNGVLTDSFIHFLSFSVRHIVVFLYRFPISSPNPLKKASTSSK